MSETLGYIAMLTGVAAAIMVSANLDRRVTGYGFVIFTFSSVVWIIYGFQDTEWPLIIQNGVLTLINIAGIYRWLIVKKGERPQ